MSVHGEYSRALEALLAVLRQLGDPPAGAWIAGLERARPGPGLDLSGAANRCLRVLRDIESTGSLPSRIGETDPPHDPLRAPFEHLHAHCRIVLGIPDETREKR